MNIFSAKLYDITFKRIIDILGSLTLLLIFFPIGLVIAIIIKLYSPGPIFADTPERVGKNGKLFKMYKFRSMVANAHMMLRRDPKMKKLYEQYKKNSYKLRQDPRVTPIGKFLRKHSLDEIPQLFNVLRGEMSIVGPRAYYPEELEKQQKIYPKTKELVKEVLKVKPGITAFWQFSARTDVNLTRE